MSAEFKHLNDQSFSSPLEKPVQLNRGDNRLLDETWGSMQVSTPGILETRLPQTLTPHEGRDLRDAMSGTGGGLTMTNPDYQNELNSSMMRPFNPKQHQPSPTIADQDLKFKMFQLEASLFEEDIELFSDVINSLSSEPERLGKLVTEVDKHFDALGQSSELQRNGMQTPDLSMDEQGNVTLSIPGEDIYGVKVNPASGDVSLVNPATDESGSLTFEPVYDRSVTETFDALNERFKYMVRH